MVESKTGGSRAPFLSGGNHKMHGKVGTGTQTPGQSSQEGKGPIGGNGKPQAGPSGAGFYSGAGTNKDYAGTQMPGVSAATKSGGDAKFAAGGSHDTLGNRGSRPAVAGKTAPG